MLWSDQVDAAAWVGADAKVDGGGARAHWSVARRKKKERRQRGRMKSEPVALFIRLEG